MFYCLLFVTHGALCHHANISKSYFISVISGIQNPQYKEELKDSTPALLHHLCYAWLIHLLHHFQSIFLSFSLWLFLTYSSSKLLGA